MQKQYRDIVFEFSKIISEFNNVNYIILFGSVARGEADKRSDIDLCVVITNNKYRKEISNIALDLEKKYDRNIQLVITKNFERLDKYFIKQLLTEGIILYALTPIIKFKNLKCKNVVIFKFSLKNLKQSEKMHIKRILYGYSTTKKYKKRIYRSSFKGLVKENDGVNLGRGAILISIKDLKLIRDLFTKYNIKYNTIELLKPLNIIE